MTKVSNKIFLVIVAMIMLTITLVSCGDNFKAVPGGDPTANTVSNNGMAVQQGDFIYFINGRVTDTDIKVEKDNKYGKVIKGGIYRSKLDGSDVKCIVPQVAYSANTNAGLSVFGNYIYFTSPKVTTDKAGALVTTYLEYYRVKIDGTGRKLITTLNGMSTEYKFTDTGLFYKLETALHYINYDNGKDIVVDEDVTALIMPVTTSYSPVNGSVADAVVYTKLADENDAQAHKFNRMFVAKKDGTKVEISVDIKDATRTLKYAQEENGSLIIYYEKGVFVEGGTNEVKGLYACKLGSDYSFNVANERRCTLEGGKTYVYAPNSYEKGVYLSNGNELTMQFVAGQRLTDTRVWDFTFAVPKITKFDGNKIYFVKDNGLATMTMLETGKNKTATTESEKFGFATINDKVISIITDSNVASDGYGVEIIGDMFYYNDSQLYTYLYAKKLDGTGKRIFVGAHSDADKETYKKYIENISKSGKEKEKKAYEDNYSYIY